PALGDRERKRLSIKRLLRSASLGRFHVEGLACLGIGQCCGTASKADEDVMNVLARNGEQLYHAPFGRKAAKHSCWINCPIHANLRMEVPLKTLADRFRHWYEYERDCNAKALSMLESIPAERRDAPEFQKAVDRLAHLCAARQRWLNRLGHWSKMPDVFPKG